MVPIRLILKEIGGRMQNAAGSIDSDSNMYKGASGKAPSDKIAGGGNKNPVLGTNDSQSGAAEIKPEENQDDLASDANVKTEIQPVGVASQETSYTPSGTSSISGLLKNLELDPTKAKKGDSKGPSGGSGAKGIGEAGESEGAADAGGDMADVAGDAASAM